MFDIHWHFKKENSLFNPSGTRRFFKRKQRPQEEPQIDPWTGYWSKISEGVPTEQLGTWMKEWQNDSNFPWQEVVQDYVNVNTVGKQPAFSINKEGGLQMAYSPFDTSGGGIGKMTPELASPFQWKEEQIQQYNQYIESMSNPALYPYAAQIVKEREAARGAGEKPLQGVNIPIGGQLLGQEASQLSPEQLLNTNGTPSGGPSFTGTELVMKGE